MAPLVKFVGRYGKHAGAKNAGFAKDDVITEIDGKSARLTESDYLAICYENINRGRKSKPAWFGPIRR